MHELERGTFVEYKDELSGRRLTGTVLRLLPAKWRRNGTEETYEVTVGGGHFRYLLRERLTVLAEPVSVTEFIEEEEDL